MEKGQLSTVIGVAIVIAVLASIATASITGNAIFRSSRTINASSCNADSVCEIGTAQASKAIVNGGISTEFIDIKSIRAQATDVDTITLNGKFIANDLVSRNSLSTNYLKASDISTYTLQTALTGNGTAYACLDSNGVLYRSLTACR